MQYVAYCIGSGEQGHYYLKSTKADGQFPKLQQIPNQPIIQSIPCISELQHKPSASSSGFLVVKNNFSILLKKVKTAEESLSLT